MKRNLVVTGGLGFIGSNFIHYMLSRQKDLKIVNVDYQGPGSNITSLHDLRKDERYRFVRGDLANFAFARRVMKKADAVVNFAAQTHVDRSIADAQPFFESNSRVVFNLVRVAKGSKIGRIVHISTDEIYGSIDKGSFDEDGPLRPSSPYSATKAAGDLIIHAWNHTYNLGIIILRGTNNFGPWQHPEKLIPKAIIRGLNGKSIPLYAGGNQVRDWVFVEDFCNAVELALEDADLGEVYNISAGNEMTNRVLCEKLLKQIGNQSAQIVDVADRPGHDFRYSLNSEKARRRLGWRPVHEFESALAKTVQWYRENVTWWKRTATEKVLSDTPWKQQW